MFSVEEVAEYWMFSVTKVSHLKKHARKIYLLLSITIYKFICRINALLDISFIFQGIFEYVNETLICKFYYLETAAGLPVQFQNVLNDM